MKLSGLLVSILMLCHPTVQCQLADKDQYPYLVELVGRFYESNFIHPRTIDEILEFWIFDKTRAKNMYGQAVVDTIQLVTFDRLQHSKKDMQIIESNSNISILCKNDTIMSCNIDSPCGILERYDAQPPFAYFVRFTSMHKSDRPGYNIASEEATYNFYKGLYSVIRKEQSNFMQQIQRKNSRFNVVILFDDGSGLRKVCNNDEFDPNKHHLMSSIQNYVTDFLLKYNLQKIYFYYVYL